MSDPNKQKYPSVKKCPRCKNKTFQCQSFESNYVCIDTKCGFMYISEGSIVTAIKNDFDKRHYRVHINETGSPDITCTKEDEVWSIEAKGETANKTVDFHTVLGQILRLMKGNLKIYYAVALPDTPSYKAKCRKLSRWLRNDLHLFFILVDGQTVECFSPDHDM